ncbi:MAG: hypothetical protein HJJLKODD_01982 [Phycisphaerae bacterium]|nr:hypothetical protein [Phycisphaerae bacterium]
MTMPARESTLRRWISEEPVPCLVCGYDLRGSPLTGRCPECGSGFDPTITSVDVIHQRVKPIRDDLIFLLWFGGAISILLTVALLKPHHWFGWLYPLSELFLLVLLSICCYLACWGLWLACVVRLLYQVGKKWVTRQQLRLVGVTWRWLLCTVLLVMPLLLLFSR